VIVFSQTTDGKKKRGERVSKQGERNERGIIAEDAIDSIFGEENIPFIKVERVSEKGGKGCFPILKYSGSMGNEERIQP